METAELVEALGERLGITLALDSDGACSFEADGLVVTLNSIQELSALVLTGDVGEPPPEEMAPLYKAMLEANHNFSGTAGATLSLDSATGRFSICRAMPAYALDVDALYAAVEGFVDTLDAWHKIVSNYRGAAPGGETPEPEDGGRDGFSAGGGFMQV